MATLGSIVITVSTVIIAAFLVYFVYRLVMHRKENHTICMALVGVSMFIALFFKLLSISAPNYEIYSDLFLLITTIAIVFLSIHMRKGFCNRCNRTEPWQVTKSILHSKNQNQKHKK